AAPVGERYLNVEVDDLKQLAKSFVSRIGPANPRLVMGALRLYSGFAHHNKQLDKIPQREEGNNPPPRITDKHSLFVE
ncbi:NAD(P)H-binding protein, partial [Pseudomonas aeruginosa]